MNDIQQLIDRYLADGLPAADLERLSRAVHRADVPEEWIVVREMLDTLSEGEDDYDLLLAARAAVPPPVSSRSRLGILLVRLAASVLLVAAIGTILFFYSGREPQVAEVQSPPSLPPTATSPQPVTRRPVLQPPSATPAVPQPAPVRPRLAAARTATPSAAAADTSVTAVPIQRVEVVERRIYSCNLLDQIPDSYDTPLPSLDSY